MPDVAAFTAHLPVRIAFGDGVIAGLPDSFEALGAKAALVLVEEPVADHPSVVSALAATEGGGARLDRVVKGPGEPTFELADELAERMRDGGLDAVVGIGGGSALDVAKAARIVADQAGSVAEYASGSRTPEPPGIGLVLCPTTAGTGSEVSGASVLTDTRADRKIGFGHPNMRAQHALGSVAHLPHGLTVGLVVAETLEVSRRDCADRLERVATALGEPKDGTTDGSRAVRAVKRMLADVGFPTLAASGVSEESLPALVASATGDHSYNLEVDSHAWDAAEVEQAFRASLALASR